MKIPTFVSLAPLSWQSVWFSTFGTGFHEYDCLSLEVDQISSSGMSVMFGHQISGSRLISCFIDSSTLCSYWEVAGVQSDSDSVPVKSQIFLRMKTRMRMRTTTMVKLAKFIDDKLTSLLLQLWWLISLSICDLSTSWHSDRFSGVDDLTVLSYDKLYNGKHYQGSSD